MEIKVLDIQFMEFKNDIAAFMVFTDKYNILIETGPRATYNNVKEQLENLGVRVKDLDYIIVTHIHLDHAGASGNFVSDSTKLKVFVHPRGYIHLNNPEKLWRSSNEILGELAVKYGEPIPIPRSRLISVSDRTDLDVGEDTLLFLHSPGHATHHMVIYAIESKVLFSGDALGCYYKNRIAPDTPKPHNYDDAIKSIERMLNLEVRAVYFTHYGIYKPGDKAINLAYEKWKLWYKILWEAYKNDLSLDDAYDLLLSKDPDARIIDKYFKGRPYGQDSLRNSVDGFLSYFKWKYEG